MALRPPGARPVHGGPAQRRADRARPARRVVEVGPGNSAVLRVAQNFNAGWRAELDGKRLAALRVDGWQQGFVVPGGAGGTVHLVFEPDSSYRTALLVGGVVALLLVVGAAASAVADA